MSGIDPKWVFYLGILVTIETAIGQGTVKLTNLMPDMWVPMITGWCTLLAFVGNVVMTALAGYSSKQAGPLVKPIIILAVVLGSFAFQNEARAQTPRLTGNIPRDIAALTSPKPAANTAATAPLSGINFNTIGQKLQALAKDVIDKGIADLSAASTDAQNHNDLIAKPCWDAQSAFLKQLPAEWQTPPTEIGPALAIQISRDLINSITGNDQSSLKVACAALIGDQISIINQTLAIVGIAGIAGLPAGL